MTKLHVLLTVCFLAAVGAGICGGMLWERAHRPPADPWLGELNLSDAQREQIKAIWADAQRSTGSQAQRAAREAARKECDEAVKALIPPGQMERYNNIMRTYNDRLAEIERKAKIIKEEAYERTKALLPADQRAKYDEIRRKNLERMGRAPQKSENTPAAGAQKE